MSYWRPFSEDARETIIRAQDLARNTSGETIGREEIFAAAAQGPSIRALLDRLGASSAALQSATESVIPVRPPRTEGEIIFTPEAKRLIERAFASAAELDHDSIANEHLLLAYLESSEVRAMLDALAVDAESLRTALLEELQAQSKRPRTEKPSPESLGELFTTIYREAGALGKRRDDEQLWNILGSAVREKDAPGAAACVLAIATGRGDAAPAFIAAVRKRLEELLGE